MRGILADINAEGILASLSFIWLSALWRELWFGLDLSIEDFKSLGLPFDTSDKLIWRIAQEQQLVLITSNRNADGPDSLEMVIRAESQPDSLPVITLADARRVLRERPYAEKTAERILDYLTRIDHFRGVGRLYAP
jgi:hypothetical protein